MTADEELAHSLKMKFGLAPQEPSAHQLQSIKSFIAKVVSSGRQPSHQDWHNAVKAVCSSIGQWKYAGIDNSDLNALLALATQSAGGSK